MVIRGGEGNDKLYAGFGNLTDADKADIVFDGTPNLETIWIYGDDDHDEIWGADDIPTQYLFGGEGDDLMYGGDEITSSTGSIIYMHGGAGDDIILPGEMI